MTILKAEIPEAGYGKKIILHNITMTVEQGKIVALIGPNGAGKSTLLKVIIGLVKPHGGCIHFNDIDISNFPVEKRVKEGLSFLPQGNRVFDELSVLENLEVGGYLLKGKIEVKERIEWVLNIFPELKERLKQNSGKLSGGEKQQLAIGRALMLRPKVLLMDEPSLGLAPKLLSKSFETIQEINKDFGITILIVEQKVREVLKISDFVYGMKMGEMVFSGKPGEIQDKERLREIFLI